MPPQKLNPGNPAGPLASNAPAGLQPPAAPTASPNPAGPQTTSGTWFQAEDPQILIQWTLSQTPAPTSAPSPQPASGTPSCTAQVSIYQQIFDAQLPLNGVIVPFSVTDPNIGPIPYIQGSLILTQNPPTLEVVNLRFPGFPVQNLALFPVSTTVPAPGGPTNPEPAAGGDTPAPGADPVAGAQPAAGSSAA